MIGEPKQNAFTRLIPFLYALPVPIYLGLVLGRYMPLPNLIQNGSDIDWFHIEIGEFTGPTIGVFLMVYAIICLTSIEPGNLRPGEEFGSEKWVTWKTLTDMGAKENKEYRDALKKRVLKKRLISRKSPKCVPNLKAVHSTNRILSKHIMLDTNVLTAKINCNTIAIGSPGSMKTTSLVYTNIMQLGGSMVVCDPKGESTEKCAPLAVYDGYDIKILDLHDPNQSLCFNPFEYVEDDDDIISMVSFMFRGFDATKDGKSNDPFWDDANMLEFAAVSYLLYYDARPQDKTLPMVLKLVNLNSVEINIPVKDEHDKVTNVKKTGLQVLFENYEQRHGSNNMPMTYYHMFRKAKDKTLSNIETTLAAKTQLLLQPKMERLFSKDELKLHELGRKRQLLFLKVPDADDRYRFVVSMVYMFLYKALYYVSDVENHANGCPVPVTILEDEFTSFPQPDNFLDIMRGCRSRNVSIFAIFQDIPSLKTMKCLKENYNALFGQADSTVFLGSGDSETCKFISELLGKETIDYKTRSRQGYSTNKTGRELATPSELRRMPKKKCIVLITGKYACYDDKYPFLRHPNIKLTAIPRDGSGLKNYSERELIPGGEVVKPQIIEEKPEEMIQTKRPLFVISWFNKIKSLVKKNEKTTN